MRKLTYYVASSIDGFIAGPDGSADFYLLEGDHAAPLTAHAPETVPTAWRAAAGITGENKRFDTVLMGRETYEIGGPRMGVASPYAHLRQYVFSRTLAEAADPAIEIVSGDPVAKVRELKAEESALGIWLCGGGSLARTLQAEIDELIIKFHPVAIGSGIPLFTGDFQPVHYRVTASHVYDSGVAVLTYSRR
ncbi:dihydrofolate reductase family protein [Amycolatopsis anabasis]|uniref:dihydrofolate reductase family protein n=1 Tax=Amycolatopsis anabasis TaxID=1840409 RepID=UPI00131BB39E|nr:dihydrofolate reductase family protein [Amycolatopsis anabasis]